MPIMAPSLSPLPLLSTPTVPGDSTLGGLVMRGVGLGVSVVKIVGDIVGVVVDMSFTGVGFDVGDPVGVVVATVLPEITIPLELS